MAASPQHVTLTAATVATFTFDADFARWEVYNVDGASAVYFTVDGSTPAVATTGSHAIAAAAGASLEVSKSGTGQVVKVISAGTPKVAVRGI